MNASDLNIFMESHTAEELQNKYENMSVDDFRIYYNLSHDNVKKVRAKFGLRASSDKVSARRKASWGSKHESVDAQKKLLLERVPKDKFLCYYIDENHTFNDTMAYFNISNSSYMSYLIQEYSAHKDKSAAAIHSSTTKLKRYGDKNYNNHTKAVATNLEKYGVENVFQSDHVKLKSADTKLNRYGNKTYTNTSKAIHTKAMSLDDTNETYRAIMNRVSKHDFEKYYIIENHSKEDTIAHFKLGTPGAFRFIMAKYNINKPTELIQKCRVAHFKAAYDVENPFQLDSVKQKSMNTVLTHYGVDNPAKSKEVLEHTKQTCRARYGVDWPCNLPQASIARSISGPEQVFINKLADYNITDYEREFNLGSYRYDFKFGDMLVEISPWPTHNSTFGIFGANPKDKNYHKDKSEYAVKHGFRCVTIFDWDDPDKIIRSLLVDKERIYARQCSVSTVLLSDAAVFCSNNHIQSDAKATIAVGLHYNGQLVSVMTFDTPRYNKNYQWELIRYCSSMNIVGGAERIWKFFINSYFPESVISYCDLSKFSGRTYTKLGFKLYNEQSIRPSLHWFNEYSSIGKPHITDNLLRSRGFDQLFAGKSDGNGGVFESYGKGSSNEVLIQEVANYIKIYDCGQATYIWHS